MRQIRAPDAAANGLKESRATKTVAADSVTAAHATPVAKAVMAEKGIAAEKVKGTGPNGRITRSDVDAYVSGGIDAKDILNGWGGSRDTKRARMSTLRKKVGERLVSVKNQTAMLTTFNEVDMSAVMDLRNKFKDKFKEEKGVGLGFMILTKAFEALHLSPT